MQYQRTLSSSSMAPSERSISSGSSNASPPQNLVALPSMRHSLAALPTMSSLPRDMMLDNAAAHSKARVCVLCVVRARANALNVSLSDGARTPETKATGTCARRAQRESLLMVGGVSRTDRPSQKAYDMRRSPSPALAEDAQITVRRQQSAKQNSVRWRSWLLPHQRSDDPHRRLCSHAIADESRFRPMQPRYHILR